MMRGLIDTEGLRGRLRYAEPMAQHTSWRVGGPAQRYYLPADADDLALFLPRLPGAETLVWTGLGSNLLVRDGGIPGTVIALHGALSDLACIAKQRLRVGAGVACAKVARFAAQHGLKGCEFLAGIPGTMGGALAMNAGAFGGETWALVRRAWVIDRRGQIRLRSRDAFGVAYRAVSAAQEEWFVGAELALERDDDGSGRERIRQLLARRAASQPLGLPSCGSVFRNPDNDHAGRLIERCGLKGFAIGAARVSPVHANFIINEGGARAADIEDLIRHVQKSVEIEQGVTLETEVQIVGVAA